MSTAFLPHSPAQTSGFSGLWIPLVTPFRHDVVDFPALTQLVQQLKHSGITGFVACGSTGEAAALDDTEQMDVLDTVLAAAGNLPVVMGLSGYHLPQTIAWVKRINTRNVAGLLVPAPHYIRPSQAGLVKWFETIANASAVPIIIYDIPYRTGAKLELETLQTLAQHSNIQAIKDCGGDAAKTQALISDGLLQVLAGEDAQLFSTVAQGGAGAISASAHIHTEMFVHVLALLAKNDLPQARVVWQNLLPWIHAAFEEPNPAPVKAMLAMSGEITSELRAPMVSASPALTNKLAALLTLR